LIFILLSQNGRVCVWFECVLTFGNYFYGNWACLLRDNGFPTQTRERGIRERAPGTQAVNDINIYSILPSIFTI